MYINKMHLFFKLPMQFYNYLKKYRGDAKVVDESTIFERENR